MSLRAVILSGQRPGPDRLCEAAGVPFKADIPICGTAMLDRVAGALEEAGLSRPYELSGYPHEREGFLLRDGGCGPADSALLAVSAADYPVLLTTCDHALLTSGMVREFVEKSEASGADFTVGLATEARIRDAYPDTKRTYLRFADVAVSGCNLFYVANEAGLNAIRFWRTAQAHRKKPLRLAAQIGPVITLRYALGKLTLDAAFDYASRRIGTLARPVIIDSAEAAIDVDSPADLALAESILSRRDGNR